MTRLAVTRGYRNDKSMVSKSVSDIHAAPEGLNKINPPCLLIGFGPFWLISSGT